MRQRWVGEVVRLPVPIRERVEIEESNGIVTRGRFARAHFASL